MGETLGDVSPTENIVGGIPPNILLLNKLFKMFNNAYIFYKNVIEEIVIELLI